MSSLGMDYGFGRTNIDLETGIRYGVIPANDLGESWYESAEADYGPPTCGECGNEAVEIDQIPFDLDDCVRIAEGWHDSRHDVLRVPAEYQDEYGESWRDEGRDYACIHCNRSFDSEDAWSDFADPACFVLDDGEYQAQQGGDDCDVFVVKSPYYTRAAWCSPCAPGAAYLRSYRKDGPKAYCFAPDWFHPWNEEFRGTYQGEKTRCPYPVWRVDNDELIYMPDELKEDD